MLLNVLCTDQDYFLDLSNKVRFEPEGRADPFSFSYSLSCRDLSEPISKRKSQNFWMKGFPNNWLLWIGFDFIDSVSDMSTLSFTNSRLIRQELSQHVRLEMKLVIELKLSWKIRYYYHYQYMHSINSDIMSKIILDLFFR